jgi:hypothetical protein
MRLPIVEFPNVEGRTAGSLEAPTLLLVVGVGVVCGEVLLAIATALSERVRESSAQ